MELENTIVVKNTPAVIAVNFDELKASLAQELEKYDVVVTADTVTDAKKLATELNKTKGIIDAKRKEEIAKASEPVKQFDEDMKELVMMCAQGRQKILDQVRRFEDETKEKVEAMLDLYREELFIEHGVADEFHRAEFDDLIRVTALTPGGKLVKGVRDELRYRVLEDKALQDRTEKRLLELENQSLKAGLSAPLTRDHVKPFLFDNDDVYQSEVQRIISVEIERQEQAEKALRLKMQREQQLQDELAPQPEPKAKPVEPEPQKSDPAPLPATTAPTRPAPAPANGKTAFEVTCVFNVEVPTGVTEHAIAAELKKVLAKAGITTLDAVYVKPSQAAA